ncbi:CLUMA_CG008548, isoform A, partial [Clunio marinus]
MEIILKIMLKKKESLKINKKK